MKKKSSTGIPRDKRIRSEVADIPKEPTFDYSDNQGIPKDKPEDLRLKLKITYEIEGRKPQIKKRMPTPEELVEWLDTTDNLGR